MLMLTCMLHMLSWLLILKLIMRQTFVIGDLHFADSRPWDIESFEKFIKWFENYDFQCSKEESELILLGDCTEKATNTGRPIDMLTRFTKLALAKFSNIIVIGGNHDVKEDNEGHFQYSTQYLSHLGDVKLVYDEEIFTTKQGLVVKALPHKKTISSLEDYYNNELPKSFYDADCDLIVGHCGLFDSDYPYIAGVKLSKFKYKYAAFGHIHQRYGQMKEAYTGSVMPFRKSEETTSLPRCIKRYSQTDTGLVCSEIPIPMFRTYKRIDFNNEKPSVRKYSSDAVYVYEIMNCNDKAILASLSKDYYIIAGKSTMALKADANGESEKITSVAGLIFKDKKDAFHQMMQNMNYHFKRSTVSIVTNLLE